MTEAIRNEGDSDRRHNVLKGLAAQASEHFDSVLIVTTAPDNDNGTYMQYCSRGNLYASVAAAERWINQVKDGWFPPSSD